VRFSRLVLENWRNFGHVDVALQSRAFLVGPNASGKSNFLDVFRFLRDLVVPGGGFEQAVIKRGGFRSLRNMVAILGPMLIPARSSSLITIDVELDDGSWRYRIVFSTTGQGQPILKAEQIWRNNKLILDRPNELDQSDPAQLRQTYLEQAIANREFREIADFFATVCYFHLVPQLMREPERLSNRENDPFGSDLIAQMARLDSAVLQERIQRIVDAVKIAMPQVVDLQLEYDENGTPHLAGGYRSSPSRGIQVDAWMNETNFSDGTLRLIGLLWSLLDANGPLLLEEPELSLHPSILRSIPQMMWHVVRDHPNGQILVSTHSSDLLWDEGIGANEIVIFTPTATGSTVQLGGDIQQIKTMLEAGLTAAEAAIPYTQPGDTSPLSLWGE
jgi:predicted ATPase